MTENPYEPPQTEVPAPLVPQPLLMEKPKAHPFVRVVALAMGYVILTDALYSLLDLNLVVSMKELREAFGIVLWFAFGLFWVSLGLTGRAPKFLDR
jgi:hypothetical protein